MNAHARLQGIAWMLFASLGFGSMSALIHLAREDSSVPEIIFWRSLVVVSVTGVIMHRKRISWRPGAPRILLIRTLTGFCGMLCYFWALGEIDLGPASTLFKTSPIFIALLSGRVLGEHSDRRTILPTLLAFLGIIFIIRPTDLSPQWGVFAALAAGLLSALAYLSVRSLRNTDPPARIVFWFSVFGAVCTAPWAITGKLPSGILWAVLFGVGVTASIGQLAMTQAYRLEKANIIGPFSYATVAISYLFGILFWHEQSSLLATLGMLMVVASGIWLSRAATPKAPQQTQTQNPPETS